MQRATYSWAHCEDSVSGIPAEIEAGCSIWSPRLDAKVGARVGITQSNGCLRENAPAWRLRER